MDTAMGPMPPPAELPEDLAVMLEERCGMTLDELAERHKSLTEAVVACKPEDASEDVRLAGRTDPAKAPLWMAEALMETIRRNGFSVKEEDPEEGYMGGTSFSAIALGPIVIPLPGEVQIPVSLTYSSKCRLLCHELCHCLKGPAFSPELTSEQNEAMHELHEVMAESAAALVMGELKAGAIEYSTYHIAINSMTSNSHPYGDRIIMEYTRPHAVILAAMILMCLQAWQDDQADQITASIGA